MRFRGPTLGWGRWALLAIAAGCGWSERRFEVEGIERLCEAAASCAGTYEASICVDRLRTADRSSCAYDGAAAADCAAEIEQAACVEIEPFGLYELTIPQACLDAYGCDWIDLAPE